MSIDLVYSRLKCMKVKAKNNFYFLIKNSILLNMSCKFLKIKILINFF